MVANSTISGSETNDSVSLDVPSSLKTLVRLIMRAFYGFELYLCMEMLIIYPCIKEEDLAELLRMDLKHVHQHLINLKKEKFINERSIMETSLDGRQSKHSYFYINYKMMVNVIKYKLDKIRIQIDSEEKQCTSRANFKCTNKYCGKTYSDLDTKDIFLTMQCLYCNAEVEEDVSCLPNRSSRNLLAIFNTQMEKVFELLSSVENLRLADDILRPEPIDMTHVLERMMNTPNSANQPVINPNLKTGKSAMVKFDSMGMSKWSGDKTRNTDLIGPTRISINFDSIDSQNKNSVRQKRELPSILSEHATTDEDWDLYNRDSQLLNSIKTAADETLYNNTNLKSKPDISVDKELGSISHTNNTLSNQHSSNLNNNNKQSVVNLEVTIMQTLLIHEKKNIKMPSETNNIDQTIDNLNKSLILPKKRDFDSIDLAKSRNFVELNHNGNNYKTVKSCLVTDHIEDQNFKKRKLNNGETISDSKQLPNGFYKTNINSSNNVNFYHSKSYSDGSDRDDPEEEESNSYYNDDNTEPLIPRITVKNRSYRLDKLNTCLINQMNDTEKEFYINVCRQLYTEIYEI